MDDPADHDECRSDLRAQRDRLEASFVHGWVTPARGPVVFTEEELAHLDRVREGGAWLLSPNQSEYLDRLAAGGRRGDPLPAAPATRHPFITGLGEDFVVRIASTDDRSRVEVLFSHEDWPGVRFGHRFPPPDEADGHEDIWLMEEVETGGLARVMSRRPQPDGDEIVWTDWG